MSKADDRVRELAKERDELAAMVAGAHVVLAGFVDAWDILMGDGSAWPTEAKDALRSFFGHDITLARGMLESVAGSGLRDWAGTPIPLRLSAEHGALVRQKVAGYLRAQGKGDPIAEMVSTDIAGDPDAWPEDTLHAAYHRTLDAVVFLYDGVRRHRDDVWYGQAFIGAVRAAMGLRRKLAQRAMVAASWTAPDLGALLDPREPAVDPTADDAGDNAPDAGEE